MDNKNNVVEILKNKKNCQFIDLPYDNGNFNSEYYNCFLTCGNGEYSEDNKMVWNEQNKKYGIIDSFKINYNKILFVGCALGLELLKFNSEGKDSYGIEISEYAVNNCDKKIKDKVKLYDGINIPYPNNTFDLVSSWDVISITPKEYRIDIIKEQIRVSNKYIHMRTQVVDDNIDKEDESRKAFDGNIVYFFTKNEYVKIFEENNCKLIKYHTTNRPQDTCFLFEKI
tara:strand:- start:5523 stop:6203 length:681 start_codon:yes stop_codon:yes gene_type:complete